ncbi:hypothetical protein [Capnocytophaga sputigena]|uniref:hypothetical protein n=1 Tax=Capnocytophaga sputigena TaxID=1019 RepID=UPI00288B1016|nr:hypothetical protein [Capnocytophaga sputigena]
MSGLHLKVLETESVKVVKDEYNFVDMDEDLKGNNYFLVSIEEYAKENKKIEDNYKKSKDAATQEYNRTYNSNKEKALEIWDINLKRITKRREKEIKKLSDKYKEVQWIWQLSPKNPLGDNMTANRTIRKGFSADWRRFHFPTFLVGGGFVYLEAFFPNDEPKKRTPYGIFVRCLGKAFIIRTEWTDLRDNPINGAVKPGSIVRLHIYTLGLYGQDIDVVLSHNEFIYKPCEVNVYNVNHNEDGKPGVSGFLNSGDKSETYLQKATLDICILKEEFGNNTDLTVDKVYSNNRKNEVLKIKGFENKILEIRENGHLYERPQGVNPIVKNEVFTNIAMFHPCGYDRIEAFIDDKKITLFDINTPEQKSSLEIVNDSENELQQLNIKTIDLKTDDCRFENTEKNHQKGIITLAKGNSENITITKDGNEEKIVLNISNIKREKTHIIEIFNDFPSEKYAVIFNSCRINHQVNIEVFEDIYFLAGFQLGTENPWYKKGTKEYIKKRYLNEKGFLTKERKRNNEDEQKEISDGHLKYTEFEYFMEYGYGDTMQGKLSFPEGSIIQKLTDSIMWGINTLNRLCFDKEADEAIEEHKEKRPEQVEKREGKRKNYLAGKNKLLSKIAFKVEIEQPTFAGAVKWKPSPSQRFPTKVGTLYEIQFKADPLISVKGSLDLLFVASKIPYVGTVVTGITKAADAIGSIDDFWNEIVEFFGGGDEHKIQIDVDYYLELFVEGSFNIEAPLLTYHTLDGFDIGNFTCESSIKIGIECGGSLMAKYGNVTSLEASFTGEASATWELSWDANTNRLKCEYGGLYAVVSTKVVTSKRKQNSKIEEEQEKNKPEEQKYLIHEGFSYEFKLD